MIRPSYVSPRFVRAYAITRRSSAEIARCAERLSRIPRTVQHVARPEGASPGGNCGAAAARGLSGGASSTSTSTVTGREIVTRSLTSRLPPGESCNATRKSCVIHSSPSWSVLTNAELDPTSTQNCIWRGTVVSTVRLAAKALSAPPMAITAINAAMIVFFIRPLARCDPAG